MPYPLEIPEPLSSSEEAAYQREKRQLDDPYWHDYGKCGLPLELQVTHKVVYGKVARISRYYCQVHDVLVDLSGYEVGHHSFDS
jgi:hypothetical protein